MKSECNTDWAAGLPKPIVTPERQADCVTAGVAAEELSSAYAELYKEARRLSEQLTKAGDDPGGLPMAVKLVELKRQRLAAARGSSGGSSVGL